MTTNITVAIPHEAVAAIQSTTDPASFADAIATTTKAVIDALKPFHADQKPHPIEPEEGEIDYGEQHITITITRLGLSNDPIYITLSPHCSVEELKCRFFGPTPWLPSAQRLVWQGKAMTDHRRPGDHGVGNGDDTFLVPGPRGS